MIEIALQPSLSFSLGRWHPAPSRTRWRWGITSALQRLIPLLIALIFILPAAAAEQTMLREKIARLGEAKGFAGVETVVRELAATGDPAVAGLLKALSEGSLYTRKADKAVFIASEAGAGLAIADPLTGAGAGSAAKADLVKIRVNNTLRGVIRDMLGALTLGGEDVGARLAAADALFRSADPDSIPVLDAALAKEADATVKNRMIAARAAAVLSSTLPETEKSAAIKTLADLGSREALNLLTSFEAGTTGILREQAAAGASSVRNTLIAWDVAQNVWYGISLGSVLLLAAIGLAITFGVMGVINMAHGEMVMIGAYTTFVVQEMVRAVAPDLAEWSLVAALPCAFLAAFAIGVVIERSVIRFLYGRPLETLLATWGVSLILQQAIRTIFGPTNREVANPGWMSGGVELGQLAITWNRLWIVIFALAVFALLLFLTNRTRWGLQMRAVTQNRRMAASMGIRTPWVDAFTFGLGSGIAGIAGVALSQIGNVSPNLGQNYIIDSFMVVVFGGVGNLWGTLLGAFSLGIVNKFLEPYAGAVLGKIIVLVLLILFIQGRPRGLFALKGRTVDA